MVIHAVSSDGVVAVMEKARASLPDVPILSVTKGFLLARAGKMDRIDLVASEVAGRPLRFVHAAGPAKAIEIARRVLTLMTFAGRDAKFCADAMSAPHMRIGTSDDIAGAEICSALKNAYATGLGLWDGFVGADCHNARAACFAQAIDEMRRIAIAGGGRADTVHGSAGVGDLHVTAAAGRNRAFGERVGKGKPAKIVAAEMLAEGTLTEGYPAIASAWRFAEEHAIADLPLLEALDAIVWKGADVGAVLGKLRLTL
jgi:glycerol-3-phosphate dehydrogenase (NAD(P)+)